MSASSSDETEFRQEDLELAAANRLVGDRRKTRAGGARSSREAPKISLGRHVLMQKLPFPWMLAPFTKVTRLPHPVMPVDLHLKGLPHPVVLVPCQLNKLPHQVVLALFPMLNHL